jgi:hypothetical protein
MIAFPIFLKPLTFNDSGRQEGTQLVVPLRCQKGLEIRLGNPNESVDSVDDEKALLDPSADCAGRDFEQIRDIVDSVEAGRRRHGRALILWHLTHLHFDGLQTTGALETSPASWPRHHAARLSAALPYSRSGDLL